MLLLNISSSLDKHTGQLTDKLSLLIGDIIPKSQSKFYDEKLSEFKTDILEILKEIKTLNGDLGKDNLISQIENRYTTFAQVIQDQFQKNILQTEDRINTNISQVKELSLKTNLVQEQLNEELSDYLNKHKVSAGKGYQGESRLFHIINDEYQSAELIRTSGQTGKGDMILKRKDKLPILIETKEYTLNVKKEETEKFIRDITLTGYSGIFLSQTSGIVGKENYQIDIHGKSILIYIHNVNYDINKINMAIRTIDNLSEKLTNLENDSINIPSELLKEINNEYKTFINSQEKLISGLKDYYKKTMELLNDIKLPSLEGFITKHYANMKKDNNITCPICKKYETNNLKSMARHKHFCKKKGNSLTISPEDFEENEVEV